MVNSSGSLLSRKVIVAITLLLTVLLMPRVTFGQGALIKNVQVNQGLGNNGNKYVAGKDTAILVFLNQATAVDEAQQSVAVKLGDAAVTTLKPKPATEPVSVLEFLCPSRPQCGEWRAGAYTFDASINGNTAQATANFQERKAIRVKAVPIKANYGGDVRVTTDKWRTLGEFARQVYPVSPNNFTWDIGTEVDASSNDYNLTEADKTIADQKESAVLSLISGQHTEQCRERPRNPNAQGCFDIIIGFVKNRIGADGRTQGVAVPGSGANVSVEGDEDAAGTVTHEIGHEYLLGDEYRNGQFRCDNNPPPPDYVGTDWITQQKNFSCTNSTSKAFPRGDGSTVQASVDFPYEISPSGGRAQARGLLPDMMSFMGSSSKQEEVWVSAPAWNRIFDALAPASAQGAYTTRMAARMSQEEPVRWIFAEGVIGSDDTVTLVPWVSYDDTEDFEDSTGDPYTLRAVDAAGATLASTGMDVDLHTLDTDAGNARGYFETDMPFPQGTAAFQILKGDKVLANRKVSANTPTVRVTAPAAGETVSADTYKIKWEASDKDGDKLSYDVEYSTDGEEWEVIAVNTEKTELDADFSELAGSEKATVRIRVWASDGVNSDEAVSGLFSVPPKAPEAIITSPVANASFRTGSLVTLSGLAYDAQDEDITESQKLVWTSDMQGELGKGTLLNLTNLKPGKHTITLKATNSLQLTGQTSIVVNIGQAPAQETTTPVPGQTRVATASVPVGTTTAVATAAQTQVVQPTTVTGQPTVVAVPTIHGDTGPGPTPVAPGQITPGGMPRTGAGDVASTVLWLLGGIALTLLLGGVYSLRKRGVES